MISRSIRAYGLAAMVAGAAGLRWTKLAPTWQLLGSHSSHADAWAIVVALVVLAGGVAVQFRRTLNAGLFLLGMAFGVAAFLWLERLLAGSLSVGYWLSLAEALAQCLGAVAAYQISRAAATSTKVRRALTLPFGACVAAFGASHFAALAFTATLVPAWIPFGGRFWAIFTGVAHIAAGVAIATEVMGYLAARLLTVMIMGFGALVWLPTLFV